jgi:hypothetical protein
MKKAQASETMCLPEQQHKLQLLQPMHDQRLIIFQNTFRLVICRDLTFVHHNRAWEQLLYLIFMRGDKHSDWQLTQ